jgi:hypothetical protein
LSSFGTQTGHASEGAGDFADIQDDTYNAEILSISAPFTDTFEGKESTKVTIDFKLLPREDQDCPEDYTRMYWLTLPETFLATGAVNTKSNLYAILDALGYDMSGAIAFESDDWIGQRLRVIIGHSKTGYPKINGFLKPLAKKGTPAAAPAGRKVAASYE